MARNLSSGIVTQITGDQLSPLFLVELYFVSGTVYFWTGFGTFRYNGNDYEGTGNLLSVSQIAETTELKAASLTLQLNGIPQSIIALAITENYQLRPAIVRFGCADVETRAMIGTPYAIFQGKMDVMEIDKSGDTGTITLTVENELIDLERPKALYYTAEEQQKLYPGDTALDFIIGLQDASLIWR